MTPRRILIVTKSLQQGGTERQVVKIIQCLDPQKFRVALCTLSPEAHYQDVPAGVQRYPVNVGRAQAVGAIRGVIHDFCPDLVHSFRDNVNRYVWQALRDAAALPWLMSIRGRPILPMDLLWARLMHRRAFRITTNSVGIERALLRFAGVAKHQIEVIPNFVDEHAFHCASASERAAARSALGLPASGFVWVLPARISWVKNQLGLMESLRRLKNDGCLLSGMTVVLAGRPRDRIPVALLPRLIRWFGLTPYVRVIGALKDVPGLYAAADALVLPSLAEGMPNVVLEAQLSGLPIVVSRQANRDGLVIHGEDGFEVGTGAPGAMARGMAQLMRMSATERQQMGERGRLRVNERFSTSAITDRLSALYEQATGSRTSNTTWSFFTTRLTSEPRRHSGY